MPDRYTSPRTQSFLQVVEISYIAVCLKKNSQNWSGSSLLKPDKKRWNLSNPSLKSISANLRKLTYQRKSPFLKIHSEELGKTGKISRTAQSGCASFVKAVGQANITHGSPSCYWYRRPDRFRPRQRRCRYLSSNSWKKLSVNNKCHFSDGAVLRLKKQAGYKESRRFTYCLWIQFVSISISERAFGLMKKFRSSHGVEIKFPQQKNIASQNS